MIILYNSLRLFFIIYLLSLSVVYSSSEPHLPLFTLKPNYEQLIADNNLESVLPKNAKGQIYLFIEQNESEAYANDRFIISEHINDSMRDEKKFPKSAVTFDNGDIKRDDLLINTSQEVPPIWVVDADGNMYINTLLFKDLTHHNHFINDRPVACAGHIYVHDGKIKYINSLSGHYKPTTLQLLLVVKYLNEQGVMAPDAIIASASVPVNVTTLPQALAIADIIDLHPFN